MGDGSSRLGALNKMVPFGVPPRQIDDPLTDLLQMAAFQPVPSACSQNTGCMGRALSSRHGINQAELVIAEYG